MGRRVKRGAGPVQVATYRLGHEHPGPRILRIGAVRRPPRGVPRPAWREYFDVWLPAVAPSAALLARLSAWDLDLETDRRRFFRAYERELARPESARLLELLAELVRRTPMALGCYCADEGRCHRAVLAGRIIEAAGRRA